MAEVIDADSHVYEPAAVWDHVPDGERARAKEAFFHEVNDEGDVTVTLNGRARHTHGTHPHQPPGDLEAGHDARRHRRPRPPCSRRRQPGSQ